MIDHISRANMDYMVRLANDPTWANEEQARILQWNEDHGATYEGKPIPCPVKPHFIAPEQRRLMQNALTNIMSALNKFVDYWLESEELQRIWNVTPEEMALYRVDPGYSGAIQIARLDGFLTSHHLKFLEFNCDSPGGTGYADVIHRGFLDLFDRNALYQDHIVSNRQRLLQLANAMTRCYDEWRLRQEDSSRPDSPFIVVSDWRDVGTLSDITITINHLKEQGLDATFADPRDFDLRDDGLYLDDRRVDVVYKRVIVKELVENPDTAPLREAYKAGHVCLVNSPRSVIVGNKKIMAALHHPDAAKIFTNSELAAIRDHVPWTWILREDKALFNGYRVNLRDFVMDNKDKLVLKAAQSYGGKDVVLGFEATDEEWHALVEKHIEDRTWVVQELATIPKELFPELTPDAVTMKRLNVNINPLAFGGEYAGAYSRVSPRNVINVSYGGGLVPAMTLEPRPATNGEERIGW